MRKVLVACAIVGLLAATALAQSANTVDLTATAGSGSIELVVSMDITGDLPAEWVGWTIMRTTVGNCETAEVGGVVAFPSGQESYTALDAAVESGINYKYEVVAVTDEGDRVLLSSAPDFSPSWLRIDYASLSPAPASVGLLEGVPGDYVLMACDGACWPGLHLFDPPQDLADLAGTGTTILLIGDIAIEFEGPYLENLAGWSTVSDCDAIVADAPVTWSGVKRSYR